MGIFGNEVVPEKGKEDEDFEGPMRNRSCTDIICLIIFAAYVVFMFVVVGIAIDNYGDPFRLLYGVDVKGDTCGRNNDPLNLEALSGLTNTSGEDLSDKKYMYINVERTAILLSSTSDLEKIKTDTGLDIQGNAGQNKIEFCLTGKVTVTNTTSSNSNSAIDEDFGQKVEKNLLNSLSFTNIVTGGHLSCKYCVSKCPENYKSLFYRCIPNFAEETAAGVFADTGVKSFFEEIVADISGSAKEIIYMCLVALGLSIVITILFRFLAGIIVYVIIFAVAGAAIVGIALTWIIWYLKDKDYKERTSNTTFTSSDIEDAINVQANKLLTDKLTQSSTKEDVQNFLALAICTTIVGVIVLLILLVVWKRVKLVVQLFREAGRAVHAMPLILLQPLLTFVAFAILAICWALGLAFIETAGIPEKNTDSGYIQYSKDHFLFWIRVYHLFGFLWMANFFVACQHMVIAGAVAGWYFCRDKKKLGMPILSSFIRLVRYHIGSVAFGSFIIALIQLIRIIMAYVERKLKKHIGSSNPINIILKVCQCCLWCFEKCMKFLNRNAYIEVAIYGYNFCKAARKAFSLLASNILRVAAINSVGTFVLFLGKAAVVASTVLIGIQIMQTQEDMVKHQWAPITLAAIFAYMIVDCFIGVYGMAIDTIFLCFCEDSDRNDGITKPYYMSVGLMEFVDNSNKALDALKKRQNASKVSPQQQVQQVKPYDEDMTPVDY